VCGAHDPDLTCGILCNGCDNVKCGHAMVCVSLLREDMNGFRQGSNRVQQMV
jgi:hypothetical protein